MYVCICIYIYIYIHTHLYISLFIYIYIYMYMSTYTFMYTHYTVPASQDMQGLSFSECLIGDADREHFRKRYYCYW